MNTLYIHPENIDEHRLRLHFNEYNRTIQYDILREIENLFNQHLAHRNRRKLKELGTVAFRELIPPEIDLTKYGTIILNSSMNNFPIQAVWMEDIPLNALFSIFHRIEAKGGNSHRILMMKSATEEPQLKDYGVQAFIPQSLLQTKNHISTHTGLLHIDAHLNNDFLMIDNIKLFRDDIEGSAASFHMLNGCNTLQLLDRPGIGQRSIVKDTTARKMNQFFYKELFENVNLSEALRISISKLWGNDISVIGYSCLLEEDFRIFSTSRDTVVFEKTFKDDNKFSTTIRSLKRPDMQSFYGNETFIQGIGGKINQTILFEGLDLKYEDIQVSLHPGQYQLPKELQLFKDWILDFRWSEHKTLHNSDFSHIREGDITRLVDFDVDLQHQKLSLQAQKGKYFDVIASNFAMDYEISAWEHTLRQRYEPGPVLNPLKESKMANIFGSGMIILTSDNHFLLQYRSKETMINADTLMHSIGGSGKFIPSHLDGNGVPHPHLTMMAQAEEELSITEDMFEKLSLVGGSRDAEFGGMPTFYYVSRLNLDLQNLLKNMKENVPEDKWEYDRFLTLELPRNNDRAYHKTIEYEKRYGTQMSSPARAAFYFFQQSLKEEILLV